MECQVNQGSPIPVRFNSEEVKSFCPGRTLKIVGAQLKQIIIKIKDWIANFVFPTTDLKLPHEKLAFKAFDYFEGNPLRSKIVTILFTQTTIDSKVATFSKFTKWQIEEPQFEETLKLTRGFLALNGIKNCEVEF